MFPSGVAKLKNHDIRAWQGTTLARETVLTMRAPKTAAETQELMQKVSTVVANKLGHVVSKKQKDGSYKDEPNWSMSYKTYIDPQVFAPWVKATGWVDPKGAKKK